MYFCSRELAFLGGVTVQVELLATIQYPRVYLISSAIEHAVIQTLNECLFAEAVERAANTC
jgi:cobalamin biosynthesis Mg chelatase CobN